MTSQTMPIERPAPDSPEERKRREEKIKALLGQAEDEAIGRSYDNRLVSRVLEFLRPYRLRVVAAVLWMVATTMLTVSGPWIIGQAVDRGLRTGDLDALRTWTLLYGAAAVGEWFCNRQRIMIMAFVGTRVVTDMRSRLFRHLHSLSLNFHNNVSVGRLMSRLIGDVGAMQDFVTWTITGSARAVAYLIGMSIAMLLLNWALALVAFAVLPLMILLTTYWRRHVREAYRATRSRLSLINGYLNESIQGIRVTQSFHREGRNLQHFDDLNRSFFDANTTAARLSALFFPGVDFLGSFAGALVLAVGGWLVLGDALTAGTLVDWKQVNHYEIYPQWRARYAPGVLRNTEHVFGLCVPPGTPVRLSPREHTAFTWLPWRAAADACFSPSNAEACLLLPRLAGPPTA